MNHGVYVSQTATSTTAPIEADSGVPFVIGVAPLDSAENPVETGVPFMATSWDDAVEALGYSDDWATYPICEFMYSHFKLFRCQPVFFCPIKKVESETETAADAAVKALESVELCLTKYGVIPDLICIPGLSDQAEVSAAMGIKASSINGMFKAKALVDIKAESYTDAIAAKQNGTYDENHIVGWPFVKSGEHVFHMSTIIAGQIAAVDTDNNGIPYESPSNKSLAVTSICNASGAEINLTHAQANMLNAVGITTAIIFISGMVLWGNYTGAYPSSKDVKDYFIPVSRMFGWVCNSLIQRFWEKLDSPMNRRLIDTIVDTCNIWLNGLVGAGYLLGARCEMLESENPTTSLMAGVIKLHIYLTPPSPAQEIDFVLEYDSEYITQALSNE